MKSLEVDPCDDVRLIGLLVLALNANNVMIQTDDYNRPERKSLVQSITAGGELTADAERLRIVARQMLMSVLSCAPGRGDSGLVARIAGRALGADTHIANMATEDFLSCLSRAGIEKVGSSLGVLPRPRVKDTRAEVIKQAAGATYVHPAALFALTEAEIARHAEAPRQYSWENADPEKADEELGDGATGAEDGEPANEPQEALQDDPEHDGEAGEGAHDDERRNDGEAVAETGNRRRRRRETAAT